ncbi:MAG: hypothetical protein RSD23_01835 [Ruthenibacterium sp.]
MSKIVGYIPEPAAQKAPPTRKPAKPEQPQVAENAAPSPTEGEKEPPAAKE